MRFFYLYKLSILLKNDLIPSINVFGIVFYVRVHKSIVYLENL